MMRCKQSYTGVTLSLISATMNEYRGAEIHNFSWPHNNKAIIKKILLDANSNYASLPFIVRKAGLDTEDVKRVLDSNSEFKKSLIKTKNGDDIYLLNSKYSWLSDAWKAFCYLNTLKY